MIVLIDNYDSFAFNVARYLVELGAEVEVLRNDAVSTAALAARQPEALVISPGPCAPDEAGVSLEAIRQLSGTVPILGICLGHQCIAQALGGRVRRAKEPMHGRPSAVTHRGSDVFAGLPSPFAAGRYHSLAVDLDPAGPLEATAWSADGEIMGLAHREHPTYGVQFHPESVLTEHGYRLMENFLKLARVRTPHAVPGTRLSPTGWTEAPVPSPAAPLVLPQTEGWRGGHVA
ncbi:aminodeoxychorismate/anthranilate synthase component II [Ancylobacter sonchi]|nr:aminodeoxychorismate/anthranilate synthase component II [Ancylobacter sonchi]MBS7536288.1 aminodeoxychorismate/anthranilate synthase component II [Ancylobacter sonchi]